MRIFSPDIRASDADRESAVDFLKAHYTAGRLSREELDARVHDAYAAVGLSRLDALTADLPTLPVAPAPRRGGAGRPLLGALAVLVLIFAALSLAPPEAWLTLIALGIPLVLMAGFFIAPLAIPIAIVAWIAHHSQRERPRSVWIGQLQPPRRGWR